MSVCAGSQLVRQIEVGDFSRKIWFVPTEIEDSRDDRCACLLLRIYEQLSEVPLPPSSDSCEPENAEPYSPFFGWAKWNEEEVYNRISSVCCCVKVTVINTGALRWHASAQLAEHR